METVRRPYGNRLHRILQDAGFSGRWNTAATNHTSQVSWLVTVHVSKELQTLESKMRLQGIASP